MGLERSYGGCGVRYGECTPREKARRLAQRQKSFMVARMRAGSRRRRRQAAMARRRLDWRQLNPRACRMARRVVRRQLKAEARQDWARDRERLREERAKAPRADNMPQLEEN